jgi:hypothetical protein
MGSAGFPFSVNGASAAAFGGVDSRAMGAIPLPAAGGAGPMDENDPVPARLSDPPPGRPAGIALSIDKAVPLLLCGADLGADPGKAFMEGRVDSGEGDIGVLSGRLKFPSSRRADPFRAGGVKPDKG